MANFNANRSLLNPKFEGYKLSPLPQDELVTRYALTSRPSQANVSGRTKTPLSFEEVQSRITHNHLTVSNGGDYALYVDEQLNVIRVSVSQELEPSFQVLFELPKPVHSPETEDPTLHKEYPSSAALPNDVWLLSDGFGLLYVYNRAINLLQPCAGYHLPVGGNGNAFVPFSVHIARASSDSRATLILSSRSVDKPVEQTSTKAHHNPEFDLWIVSVPCGAGADTPQPLDVSWHGCGSSLPHHVGVDESRDLFYILAGSPFRTIGSCTPPSYVPTTDELAPIPRAEEKPTEAPAKPPPYSWTQTDDSLTVAFPLPSHIPKTAIKVLLTPKTTTVTINAAKTTPIDLPHYSAKPLWDGISPSSSFWTWDKEGDREFGLLTLHLDKQHEGTRWPHVFSTVGTRPSSDKDADHTDVEVPETVDPSELWHIREALEKYTNALRDGEDASGFGLGRGVPSLAEGELDATVDASVGRQFFVTWVGTDGISPPWASEGSEGLGASLLAVPLPGARDPSIVVKSDIDGLLFRLPRTAAGPTASAWTHVSTFPALAFVLASKRDLRFTFHVSTEAVLAFESGTGNGGGNVYIYWKPNSKDVWAKQAILKISGGSSGALLGVGTLQAGPGGRVILCLTEQELVIVKAIGQ